MPFACTWALAAIARLLLCVAPACSASMGMVDKGNRVCENTKSCTKRPRTEGVAMIQRRQDLTGIDVPSSLAEDGAHVEGVAQRTRAADSRFLIQCTFGPTQAALQALGQNSYEEWIDEQMAMPAESHREAYRRNVNPHFIPDKQPHFKPRPPCARGSRWQGYAFTRADIKTKVLVENGPKGTRRILVGDIWVTDIDPESKGNGAEKSSVACTDIRPSSWRKKSWTCKSRASSMHKNCRHNAEWKTAKSCQQTCYDAGSGYEGDDCSGGWAKHMSTDFRRFLCSVEGGVGGLVSFSSDIKCKKRIYMPNPAIWLADGTHSVDMAWTFTKVPALPDVKFLVDDVPSCPFSGSLVETSRDSKPSIFGRHKGWYYLHSARVELMENVVERPRNCAPKSFLNAGGCQPVPPNMAKDLGCDEFCGSPGEVANVPEEGHQFPMLTHDDFGPDMGLDNRYGSSLRSHLAKSVVWTAKALEAKDQLRQRMAWALSQIFVVSANGFGDGEYSEFWLNYYDVFVRNAFGNFRDVLREVTYSPLMGDYLTYRHSRSYDMSRTYPDENYAREIMQLFTIGLDLLHENGTVVVDEHGEDVPTYSNENIMDFARVFTGFAGENGRFGNSENFGRNRIDPMQMVARFHDRYPKPDLGGGFLGDGYPLCAEIPLRAFLAKGAIYEFQGYANEMPALVLHEGTPLFEALCVRKADGACGFSSRVTLPRTIACKGVECKTDVPELIKVGIAFYSYQAPACVYHFFYAGVKVASGTNFRKQVCVDPTTPVAAASCCRGCTNIIPGNLAKKGITCENHSQKLVSKKSGKPTMFEKWCNRNTNWRKKKYCQLTCWKSSPQWDNKLAYEGDDCSMGPYQESRTCENEHERVRLVEAEAQCASRGMAVCSKETKARCDNKDMHVWTQDLCANEVVVNTDGKISAHTSFHEQNRFAVRWASGKVPAAGTHKAIPEVLPVFDTVPTKTQVLAKLKIGAFPPENSCTHACDSEVKIFAASGRINDTSTVFECEGRFFRNAESIVHVGEHSFRNPPVFLRPGPIRMHELASQRAALNEVESLLDHLFHHPNTPVFVAKKLIQRFVGSNPSAAYMTAVVQAFKSGTYDEKQYSGEYGDLGATIAAILLHPEARQASERNTDGLLREPVLKLMHILRAMGYVDSRGEFVVFRRLVESIGQFPYQSPTVFNFYDAMFQPDGLSSKAEPGLEPEPEPEPEQLVAPEFQIFTPPSVMMFFNGLASLLKQGVVDCDEGFGVKVPGSPCQNSGGMLSFSKGDSDDETLEDLNILLTGGRLSPHDFQIVRAAYEGAAERQKVQAAQQAIFLTPEFHNLGDPKPNGTRPKKTPEQKHEPRGYRATVLLFLAGGADTFNMLVPRDCALYDEYKKVRTRAAHKQSDLLPITADSQVECKAFGIHPALPYLRTLYKKKQAAFVSNIGALLQPVTAFDRKRKRGCVGGFSHSHMQAAAQTLQCQVLGAAPRGVGGRVADDLAAQGYRTTSFSVSGTTIWSKGFETHTEIIDAGRGAVRFRQYEMWADAITNITSQKHGNIYCEEYAQAFADAIESSESLGSLLEDVRLKTKYVATTSLQKQLHQVARLIATRDGRKAERDFFFVQLGGFDTHRDLIPKLQSKFQEINDALEGFVTELEQQGVFDLVTLVTESDFGRTMTFNGAGTDHGWGGNHFIVSGALKGGNIFNDFLETYELGSKWDAGRGRVIPKYPWESMMVPIAEWMGLKDTSVAFPNLGNFNRSTHIIARDALFKS